MEDDNDTSSHAVRRCPFLSECITLLLFFPSHLRNIEMPALTQTVLNSLLCSSAVLVYLFRIVFLTLITGEVKRWWFREDYVKVEATASDWRSKTLIAARYDIKSSRLSNSHETGWPAER